MVVWCSIHIYKVYVADTYNQYTVLRFYVTTTSTSLGHQELTVFHTERQCNTYIMADCCDFKCMPYIVAASHVTVSVSTANFTLYTAYYTQYYTVVYYTVYTHIICLHFGNTSLVIHEGLQSIVANSTNLRLYC